MYSGASFSNPAELADSLDERLDQIENSIGFDPIIGYTAIPIYNEVLRFEPVTVFGVARGNINLLRVGRGTGQAIYCEDLDGWERAIRSAEDISRASTLFAILAAPAAAGKGGGTPQSSRGSASVVRNGKLAGQVHPVTKVPFNKAGFPDFSAHLYREGPNTVRISPTGSRTGDFTAANRAAGYASTPRGYVWHHNEKYGVMQLVDSTVHLKTGHTGGFNLW